MLDAGCWMLDTGYWIMDARCGLGHRAERVAHGEKNSVERGNRSRGRGIRCRYKVYGVRNSAFGQARSALRKEWRPTAAGGLMDMTKLGAMPFDPCDPPPAFLIRFNPESEIQYLKSINPDFARLPFGKLRPRASRGEFVEGRFQYHRPPTFSPSDLLTFFYLCFRPMSSVLR